MVENEIKLGSVVQLKSGGPNMTVIRYDTSLSLPILCVFIEESGDSFVVHEIEVCPEALKAV